ncbi:probable tRNA N6-adenosine threonylcarbamoyltransferase, mitochondrial [Leguminivora glycinivorella]|uniref:probable tRNA N6-adenosine threonylcarbamoyltransferase, mitochondrial n=1 Tax=Leguminivora glycinivorella TaxID=1035111 RepID=UPI00200CF1F8|nr:probable tRNA N6-adenosine threonylcarbamoyltransferase, mitochondrial [Leguminivora glycinivorella]
MFSFSCLTLRRLHVKSLKLLHRKKHLTFSENTLILGIETSCDDTGCAIVSGAGNILGETLYSQNVRHLKYGGINPTIAHELHRDNIRKAVNEALDAASKRMDNIDAIAVTVKPGLVNSLEVGVRYAKHLSRLHNKPLIPIHHMEAHALVARMYHNIPFPFLALLISGGNSLLAAFRDVDDVLLLGDTLDNSPGEIMDKVARRMKLRNIPDYSQVAGGRAIELAAKKADKPDMFEFPLPLVKLRDCSFSFSGLKDFVERKLKENELEHRIIGDRLIPEINNLCAGFLHGVAEHIAHRTERAAAFCEANKIITSNKSIVVSGGVACNDYIFNSIKVIGDKRGYQVYRPPPRVCTDNGVMIAWNGIEKLKSKNECVILNSDVTVDPYATLGKDIINDVKAADIQVRVTRIRKKMSST